MNDSASSRKETFAVKFDLDNNKVFWKGPEGEKTKRFEDLTRCDDTANGNGEQGRIDRFLLARL